MSGTLTRNGLGIGGRHYPILDSPCIRSNSQTIHRPKDRPIRCIIRDTITGLNSTSASLGFRIGELALFQQHHMYAPEFFTQFNLFGFIRLFPGE